MTDIDITSMNEKELKTKANDLRTQIDHHERELKGIFRELKLHRTNTDELKEKRDALNSKVKVLVAKARDVKSRRDSINAKIAALKSSRNEVHEKSRQFSDDISELKTKRDDLNKLSKGSVETLSKAYAADLDLFLNADIPLNHEVDLFGRLLDLKERLGAAFDANDIHQKLMKTYEASKDVFESRDDFGDEISKLAEESQKYHLEMIDFYNQADELRKAADGAHLQISEKYSITAPIREKIDPLKKKIAALRDELGIYLEKLNDIQVEKDDKKQEEHLVVAKEKLEKSGRLSLEDLKVLMEKGDLKF
ncbi:phosphoserine phosphatase [uncultured Methanolobus sp.]|uniref:coiled-coil protein n=1 Tax=uncultured Methanolobus sp. TaxID=218300 RepID=UPI0029C8CC0B|nr:phosphoserine phosphatase [uncultured Methanolobus sp.]